MIENARVRALCLVVCAVTAALVARDDPLSESYTIQRGEGQEIAVATTAGNLDVHISGLPRVQARDRLWAALIKLVMEDTRWHDHRYNDTPISRRLSRLNRGTPL